MYIMNYNFICCQINQLTREVYYILQLSNADKF